MIVLTVMCKARDVAVCYKSVDVSYDVRITHFANNVANGLIYHVPR